MTRSRPRPCSRAPGRTSSERSLRVYRADRTEPLEQLIRTNLDQLYKVGVPRTATLWEFDEPTDIKAMTLGPDGAVYYIAPSKGGRTDSVFRLNKKHNRVYEIIKDGDTGPRGGRTMGRPRLLAITALPSTELLVVDDSGRLWRWRQHPGDKGRRVAVLPTRRR